VKYRWQSLLGKFEEVDDAIWFRGLTIDSEEYSGPSISNLICDQVFSGGTIFAEIEFKDASPPATCELVLYYDPGTGRMVTAGLGAPPRMFAVRHFDGSRWYVDFTNGDRDNLQSEKRYQVTVTLEGSWVVMTVDGIKVASVNLPMFLPRGQVGAWCFGANDIAIRNFDVCLVEGRAFVVMEYGPPYDELYSEVIRPVCKELDLETIRADEVNVPGLVIEDIERDIRESKLIIADISPSNANVYYEVGYARGINKPIILVAEKGTKLPFDVMAFRTLFYENSIGGKGRFVERLKKSVEEILRQLY
jgi:hypothetical protein